jgi:hypothetical protein
VCTILKKELEHKDNARSRIMDIEKSNKGSEAPLIAIYTLVAVLILVTAANVFTVGGINTAISGKMAAFEDKYGPAEVTVTKLLYQDCNDCFDLNQAMDMINSMDIAVTEMRVLDYDSQDARSLIDKYDIERLPTVVITGETEKDIVKSSWKGIGDVKDDGAVVFTKQALPYYDVAGQSVLGLVTITNLVDSSCTQCIDMSPLIDAFRQAGVTITSQETFEYNTPEAEEFIERFDIQKVPSLVISKGITEYDAVKEIWSQLDAIEKDEYYVLHALQPPFRDLQSGEIAGMVKVVNIVDSSCSDCYNISLFGGILQRFGVAVSETEEHDISTADGKSLVDKYIITRVPTVLLSPETSGYPALSQVWPQVGSIEDDGWFVFREPSSLGENINYRDLE